MNDTRRQFDAGALFTGIVLIAFGVLFLLDRAGVADFGYVISEWWPMFIVVIGVTRVASGRLWPGLWLVFIGTWLQAVELRVFGLTFGNSWPLLLIFVGAGMIVRTVVESRWRRERASPEPRREP